MRNRKSSFKKGIGGWVYDIIVYGTLSLLAVSILYVVMYLLSLSLSGYGASLNTIKLWPVNFTLDNYKTILGYRYVHTGYINTIKRVVLGVSIEIILCLLTGYVLSRKNLPNRTLWTGMIVLTMFVSGGLIPFYILMRNLNLMNTIWSLVLPGAIPTYSMLLVRNYIMALPDSLEESAKIDGANDFVCLFRIVIPVITPIIACLALWGVVGHWNAWFDSMLYIRDMDKQVLQTVVQKFTRAGGELDRAKTTEEIPPETLKAAIIFTATFPVLVAYPFFQRFFVKGILVGSLKG
ncbi:MAG: carbohydrate ABC transporter permease [Christensenellales bacterium]|jgi:putative aldouronate transport system permease protein